MYVYIYDNMVCGYVGGNPATVWAVFPSYWVKKLSLGLP